MSARPMAASLAALLAASMVAGACCAPAQASSLLIDASGFAEHPAPARLEVFSSRVGFPDQPRFRETQPADPGGVQWRIDELPTGDYAVLVWHDLDDDGVFDRSVFGAPQEPYGYSNGARGRRLDWDEVRVTLGPEPLTIEVAVD